MNSLIVKVATIATALLLSSLSSAQSSGGKEGDQRPIRKRIDRYETPESMEQPPRKMAAEAEQQFGWFDETPEPPIKRWVGQEDFEANAAPANTNRRREQQDADDSADEVINPAPSRSRSPTEDTLEVNSYVSGLMARAGSGDLEATFQLAEIYFEGRQGVEADEDTGLNHLVIAAEGGYLKAQAYLGRIYEFGLHGQPVDHAQAIEWYQRAMRNRRGIKQAREGLRRLTQRPAVPAVAVALVPAAARAPTPVLVLERQPADPNRPLVMRWVRRAAVSQGSGIQ